MYLTFYTQTFEEVYGTSVIISVDHIIYDAIIIVILIIIEHIVGVRVTDRRFRQARRVA